MMVLGGIKMSEILLDVEEEDLNGFLDEVSVDAMEHVEVGTKEYDGTVCMVVDVEGIGTYETSLDNIAEIHKEYDERHDVEKIEVIGYTHTAIFDENGKYSVRFDDGKGGSVEMSDWYKSDE